MMDSMRDDDRPELEVPLLQGLGQAVPQVDPPLELRARVLRSLEPRGHEDTTKTRGQEGTAEHGTPEPWNRQAQARPVLWWLATAASLALAAGMTIYTTQLRTRITGLESQLRDAQAQADASQRQMADAQRAATGAQISVAILTAPDVARVDLAGQPVSPNASARAFWSRSRGMVFNASNLPALPAGRTYQLWVVTSEGPASAGLLTPDAQGSVSETFITPPDIPQPVAMAVTIEPAGGVPAPTGERFLVGTL